MEKRYIIIYQYYASHIMLFTVSIEENENIPINVKSLFNQIQIIAKKIIYMIVFTLALFDLDTCWKSNINCKINFANKKKKQSTLLSILRKLFY